MTVHLRRFRPIAARVFHTTGDSILVEFPSVVDAMRCAAEVQRGKFDCNAAIPADERLEVRIRIDFGEIIVDGEDDGVNAVAALEGRASAERIVPAGWRQWLLPHRRRSFPMLQP